MSPEMKLLLELTIQTRPVAAAVQLLLTVRAGVAGRAAACVASSHRLHARSTIKAGTVCTGHGDDFTVLSIETLWAGAGVVVLQVLETYYRFKT